MKVGMFDENFIFTKEDDDLCYRMRKAGYLIAEVKNSIVYHNLGSSTNMRDRNSVGFLARNTSRGYAILFRKGQISIFSAFLSSLKDNLRLLVKSYLLYRKLHFSIMIETLVGFNEGLAIEY